MFALNSGALLRVSAIREIGGFPPQFWLHHLDLCLHHLLHRAGKRIYVAGDIQADHSLSLSDYRSLSPQTYRWFLQAESAFVDLYLGHFRGAVLTATLAYRYLNQKRRGDSAAILHETLRMLKRRLRLSRRTRIDEWNTFVEQRYRS
jgi:GT2 family glycosyltransferase